MAAGLTPSDCPVVSFSLAEDELRSMPTKDMVGELRLLDLFHVPENARKTRVSLKDWNGWLAHRELSWRGQGEARGGQPDGAFTRWCYTLWKQAVEKAGTFDVDAVRTALESGSDQLSRARRQDHHAGQSPRDQERVYRRDQG